MVYRYFDSGSIPVSIIHIKSGVVYERIRDPCSWVNYISIRVNDSSKTYLATWADRVKFFPIVLKYYTINSPDKIGMDLCAKGKYVQTVLFPWERNAGHKENWSTSWTIIKIGIQFLQHRGSQPQIVRWRSGKADVLLETSLHRFESCPDY